MSDSILYSPPQAQSVAEDALRTEIQGTTSIFPRNNAIFQPNGAVAGINNRAVYGNNSAVSRNEPPFPPPVLSFPFPTLALPSTLKPLTETPSQLKGTLLALESTVWAGTRKLARLTPALKMFSQTGMWCYYAPHQVLKIRKTNLLPRSNPHRKPFTAAH